MKSNYIFISHSTKDGEFVNALRKGLENEGLDIRTDSRESAPGDELENETKQAIEQARAFIVVIGSETINSLSVLKETKYALEVRNKGVDDYKVIPLIREGVELAVLSTFFGKEPIGTKIQIGSGGISEAISLILVAFGERLSEKQRRSLFDGIEHSLRRLSSEIREKIKPLGVFQGGSSISNITNVLKLNETERDLLVSELMKIGLAEPMPYGFLRFHPALCPYLYQELDEAVLDTSKARWAESLRQLSEFLYKQQSEDSQLADSLTLLELPNLIKSLEYVQAKAIPEITLDRAVILEQLTMQVDKPQTLAKVKTIMEEEEKKSVGWEHVRFEVLSIQVEKLLDTDNFPQALSVAQILLDKCMKACEGSYEGADYDIAVANLLLGRVLRVGGTAEDALKSINEAHRRFQLLADQEDTDAAGNMVSASLAKKGECLLDLGRLDESAAAYEKSIHVAEELKSERHIAVGKGQLGTVRFSQGRYEEAIKAHNEAREIFETLGEPDMAAIALQQQGVVFEEIGQFEEAEQAFQQSLAVNVQQKNHLDEARSLGRLGSLYAKMGRSEDAVTFLRRSAEKYTEINDMANEGRVRGNLTITLIMLKRYDEARQEIQRAIECFKPYGHHVEPWRAWDKLRDIELADGNQEAAALAREQAIQLYLTCRRDGGENQSPSARLCAMFEEAMEKQTPEEVKKQLNEVVTDPDIPASGKLLISKLQAILAGSREVELASDAGLDYTDTAEILFLLERLER
ncbi:MAG: toll/interleukin-1 receptor domain-containing protein [Candidatus Scalindua sp.]